MMLKNKDKLFRKTRGWYIFSKVIHFYLRLFYKQIVVEGKELIPKGCPVIFAPNHQNALMDPLILHFGARMQTVFLARADIFKIPVLRDFFFWLKILPVFRIRDGIENLQNNDESFNIAVEVLEHGRSVGIFPEATHTNLRRLLPLKKGVPRLAFLAESKNNFSLGIKVIPVGIHYSNYEKMHSTVHIRFGEAIEVATFRDAWLQNQQKAMLLLRDEIGSRISDLAINIKDTHSYDTIFRASELLAKPLLLATGEKRVNQEKKFKSQRAITRILEQDKLTSIGQESSLFGKTEEFVTLLTKFKVGSLGMGIKPGVIRLTWFKIFLVLFVPVYLYGALNGIPKSFFLQLLLKKFKDRQFHSSIKYVWGMVVAPLFFVAQAALVWVLSGNALWALVYLLSIPIGVVFSKIYLIWIEKFISALRLVHLRLLKPQLFNRVLNSFHVVLEGLGKAYQKM
ncbi:MAG TPA: 1-acyl-sn-glycerol-3-phosphate acyltransferase [Bacteroidales bacterium]|nr:1-acyl-sn-glycerol-3-phosphate acyltransferase [Bacteroidales bacterium]